MIAIHPEITEQENIFQSRSISGEKRVQQQNIFPFLQNPGRNCDRFDRPVAPETITGGEQCFTIERNSVILRFFQGQTADASGQFIAEKLYLSVTGNDFTGVSFFLHHG